MPKDTSHMTKDHRREDMATYVERQWIKMVPWWFHGVSPPSPIPTQALPRLVPPNSNNALEATIGVAKKHAGSHASGATNLGKFMLDQVQFWSKATWDANATRKPKQSTLEPVGASMLMHSPLYM